jgi:hypothetical protein
VIDPAQDFVDRAVAQLQVWEESPQALQQASKAARERFLEICGENKERWESVRAEMCGWKARPSDGIAGQGCNP